MKVELSIADDRELREHIRDVIKGEVVAIARGEVKSILKEVMNEGLLPKDQASLEKIVANEVREVVKRELDSRSYQEESFVKKVARAQVNEYLREYLKDIIKYNKEIV